MESIEYQVWMSKLINLDKSQDVHDVHDGGVELEAGVARAEVEYSTTDSLQDHTNTKGVENTVLLV